MSEDLVQFVQKGLFEARSSLETSFQKPEYEIFETTEADQKNFTELRLEMDLIVTRFADSILDYLTKKHDNPFQLEWDGTTTLHDEEKVADLQRQLMELQDNAHRQNAQMESLRAQLSRRNHTLAEQRSLFFKELLVLKEQLFQRERLGDAYTPFMMSLFNPDSLLGGEQVDGMEEQKKRQQIVENLTKRFQEERRKVELQFQAAERGLTAQLQGMDAEMKTKEIEWESKTATLEAKYASDLETQRLQAAQDLEDLRDSHRLEFDRLTKEHEDRLNQVTQEAENRARQQQTANQQELEQLRFKQRTQEETMEQLKHEYDKLTAKLTDKSNECNHLRQQFHQSTQQFNEEKSRLQSLFESVDRERTALKEEHSRTKRQLEKAKGDTRSTAERYRETRRELEELKKYVEQQNSQLELLRAENDNFRGMMKTAEENANVSSRQAASEADELKRKLDQNRRDLDRAATQRQEAVRERERDLREEFTQQLNAARDANAEEVAHLERKVQSQANEIKLLRDQNDLVRNRMTSLRTEGEAETGVLRDARTLIDELKSKRTALEKENRALHVEVEELRAKLNLASQDEGDLRTRLEEALAEDAILRQKLRQSRESLHARPLPLAAIQEENGEEGQSSRVDQAKLQSLADAVQRDAKYVRERAINNWGIFARGVSSLAIARRVQLLRAQALREGNASRPLAPTDPDELPTRDTPAPTHPHTHTQAQPRSFAPGVPPHGEEDEGGPVPSAPPKVPAYESPFSFQDGQGRIPVQPQPVLPPVIALSPSRKEEEKKRIKRLSVFERLHERARNMVDKFRKRKEIIERERKQNMERVLAAASLLVEPFVTELSPRATTPTRSLSPHEPRFVLMDAPFTHSPSVHRASPADMQVRMFDFYDSPSHPARPRSSPAGSPYFNNSLSHSPSPSRHTHSHTPTHSPARPQSGFSTHSLPVLTHTHTHANTHTSPSRFGLAQPHSPTAIRHLSSHGLPMHTPPHLAQFGTGTAVGRAHTGALMPPRPSTAGPSLGMARTSPANVGPAQGGRWGMMLGGERRGRSPGATSPSPRLTSLSPLRPTSSNSLPPPRNTRRLSLPPTSPTLPGGSIDDLASVMSLGSEKGVTPLLSSAELDQGVGFGRWAEQVGRTPQPQRTESTLRSPLSPSSASSPRSAHPHPRAHPQHTTSLAPPLQTAEHLDLRSNRWVAMPGLPTARSGCAAVVCGDFVYLLGGFDGRSPVRSVERYSPEMHTFTHLAPMACPRAGLSAFCVGNTIYVVGGWDGMRTLNSIEKYDIRRNMWTPITSMKTARQECAMVVLKDQLYCFGGARME